MNSLINQYFGKKLKHLRNQVGEIQKVMSAKFGMKQQNYCKLEQGKLKFSNKTLYKIQKEFNISPEDFISKPSLKANSPIKVNLNSVDDYTTRILIATLRKEITELKLQKAELEIEVRRYRVDYQLSNDSTPVYVII